MAEQEEAQAETDARPPASELGWAGRYEVLRKEALFAARRLGLRGALAEDAAEDVAVDLSRHDDRPMQALRGLVPKRLVDWIRRWHHLERPHPTKTGSTAPLVSGPRSIPMEIVENPPEDGLRPGQHGPVIDPGPDVPTAAEPNYVLRPLKDWDTAVARVLDDPSRWPVGSTAARPVPYQQTILTAGIAGAGDWCRWAARSGADATTRQRRARGTLILFDLVAGEFGYPGGSPALAAAILKALDPETLREFEDCWTLPPETITGARTLAKGLRIRLILGAWEASE